MKRLAGLLVLASLAFLILLQSRPNQAAEISAAAPAGDWTSFASGDEVLTLRVEPGHPERVWAGTEGGGLVVWDAGVGGFRQHLHPDPLAPAGSIVRDIAFGAQGDAWLASSEGVSVLASGLWRHFGRADGLPADDIGAIALDGNGRVWAGAGAGLSFLEAGASRWTKVAPEDFDPDQRGSRRGPGAAAVADIALDHEGRLWIAHGVGGSGSRPALSYRLPEDGSWRHVAASSPVLQSAAGPATDQILAIDVDPESGDLWLATWGRGLSRMRAGSSTWERLEPSECGRYIRAILARGGGVWAACGDNSRGRGLAHYRSGSWRTWLEADGLSSASISSLALVGGVLLAGTNGPETGGEGILMLDANSPSPRQSARLTTAPQSPASNDMTALAIEPGGSLWVGTRGAGLLHRDSTSGLWSQHTQASTGGGLAGDTITDLLLAQGQLWVASTKTIYDGRKWADGGLARLDLASGDWRSPIGAGPGALPDRELSSLAEDAAGKIWIGIGAAVGGPAPNEVSHAGDGIAVYDPADGSWKMHAFGRRPDQLAGATVLDLVRSPEGAIWAASSYHNNTPDGRSYGGGVSRFHSEAWRSWYGGDAGLVTWNGLGTGFGSNAYISGDVRSLASGASGAIWAGSWAIGAGSVVERWPWVDAMANRFDGSAWTAHRFAGAGWVSALLEDGQGRTWVGTTRGHARSEAEEAGPADPDRAASLFVQTAEGWATLDPKQSGLVSRAITALAMDPGDRSIWIATENGGLSHFEPISAADATATALAGSAAASPTVTPTLQISGTVTPTLGISLTATLTPTLTISATSQAAPTQTVSATMTASPIETPTPAEPSPTPSPAPSSPPTPFEPTPTARPTAHLPSPSPLPDRPGAGATPRDRSIRIYAPIMLQRRPRNILPAAR